MYSFLSRFFHWGMALIILALLPLGFFMVEMDFSPWKLSLYGWHKSFGLLVLFLAALRVMWRLFRAAPPALETHTWWEKALSKLVHILLYSVIFLMPLSGWVMSSAGDFPNSFFGVFEMPDLVAKNKALFEILRQSHTVMAYGIMAVVGVHMVGALKHHFIDRDLTLKRMTRESLGFVGGGFIALIFGGALCVSAGLIVQDYMSHQDVSAVAVVQGDEASALVGEDRVFVKNSWMIVPEKSYIKFTATQYGQEFEGAFSEFNGVIIFDPENLSESRVNIVIDIASILTGSDDRDRQALGAEWFAVDDYKDARFEASAFRQMSDGRYEAIGTLRIRDVSQALRLPFSLRIEDDGSEGRRRAFMHTNLSLHRLDFSVGQGQWESGEAIGLDIELDIQVEAEGMR